MILFIVTVYMLAMLAVGWWANKYYIKGMTDFLLAGRRLGVECVQLPCRHPFRRWNGNGRSEYGFLHGWSGAWARPGVRNRHLDLSLYHCRQVQTAGAYTVPDYLE